MGLVDMFVTGFCFNLTCPLEPYVSKLIMVWILLNILLINKFIYLINS